MRKTKSNSLQLQINWVCGFLSPSTIKSLCNLHLNFEITDWAPSKSRVIDLDSFSEKKARIFAITFLISDWQRLSMVKDDWRYLQQNCHSLVHFTTFLHNEKVLFNLQETFISAPNDICLNWSQRRWLQRHNSSCVTTIAGGTSKTDTLDWHN